MAHTQFSLTLDSSVCVCVRVWYSEQTLFETAFSSRMGVWLLYFPKIWWCHFPFLYILIPILKCSLANWFQWVHTGFVSTMINWCNVDTSPKEQCNLEKWHWKHFYSPYGRLVCILGTVTVRRTANPLPASAAQAIYRQYMKYGSYLIESKTSRDFIFCVWYMWWLSQRETEMIAYGIMVEWETITKVICSCYLELSTHSPDLTTVSVTGTSLGFFCL